MKKINFKVSKYNYFYKNEGSILMYNSLMGSSSFLKIDEDNWKKVINCLNNIIYYKDEDLIKKLSTYGYVVDENFDEDIYCQRILWERVLSNQLFLVLIPTEGCNFRCKYCYENHENRRMDIKSEDAIVRFVKKNIHRFKSVHVTWFGGEPLLETDRIISISQKLIKICKSASKIYTADIITNGFFLTDIVCNSLIKCKIYSFQVTIDGLKTQHDKVRCLIGGQSNYDVLIDNLLNIKRNVKSNYVKIIIRTNMTYSMEYEAKVFYNEMERLFHDDKRFTFFFRPVGDWGGTSVKEMYSEIFSENQFKEIYKVIADSKINLDFGQFVMFYDSSICSACFSNGFIFGPNRKVYKCSCHFEEEKNCIGYLMDNGELKIDYAKQQKWTTFSYLMDKCKDCFFKPACHNMSCPAYSNNIVSKSNDSYEDCPFERKFINETFVLLDKCGYFKKLVL